MAEYIWISIPLRFKIWLKIWACGKYPQFTFHYFSHSCTTREPSKPPQRPFAAQQSRHEGHEITYDRWWNVGLCVSCYNIASVSQWKSESSHRLKKAWQSIMNVKNTQTAAFFNVKVGCIRSLFLEAKQWINNSTWLFYSVFEDWWKETSLGRTWLVSSVTKDCPSEHVYHINRTLPQPCLIQP
jgi:hypothetical protein